MLCLSSKKSLLSGVSAVVLATTVGVSAVGVSGALAQATYTSNTTQFWASGTVRNGNPSDTSNTSDAKSGDNLTITGAAVGVQVVNDGPDGGGQRGGTGQIEIGILRSGTSGAGRLSLVACENLLTFWIT